MDLDAVADELYALRPEEFVAARDRRALDARRSGEQGLAAEIGALRRPSLAAWVSNLLVRREPDEVPPLLALGEELRRAHRELDGPRLRRLARRQNEVIGALARQARRLAGQSGHPVGEGVQREVEETLHAALADADADAVREWAAGRLVKPLHATVGFPAADATPPDRRTATPASGPGKRATDDEPTGDPDHAPGERPRVRPDHAGRQAPTSRPDREAEEERRESRRRLAEARTRAREAERDLRAREAERDLRAREQEAEAAEDEAAEAGARAAELEERVRELEDRLREARAGQGEARAAARAARERSRRAEQAVGEARRRAVAATERADRPTPG
ncbi:MULTISPECIES: hypothetical protein [unclassified Streptomyces]|uniref:hypothetical protein n=1 Tax=unclassified Streptomyces TaxID=2593676 RepID=UPI00093ACFAD|nr:hypothetical protein [Streptomyces sp. CB01883]OKJ84427.1 hypothetical protein AMK32_10340 [Streptomyces sp. CB01883]